MAVLVLNTRSSRTYTTTTHVTIQNFPRVKEWERAGGWEGDKDRSKTILHLNYLLWLITCRMAMWIDRHRECIKELNATGYSTTKANLLDLPWQAIKSWCSFFSAVLVHAVAFATSDKEKGKQYQAEIEKCACTTKWQRKKGRERKRGRESERETLEKRKIPCKLVLLKRS